MSYGTVQAEKMTTESGYSLGAGNASSFKNRIINGGMVIDQRTNGAVSTPVNNTYPSVDRFKYYLGAANKCTTQRLSASPPPNFTNYLNITSTSAYSIGASEANFITQIVEGFSVSDLGWGTANAKPITLSFWVQSSLTGTFGGTIVNYAQTTNWTFAYTITAANTWQQVSITFAGPTTGVWNLGTNEPSMYVAFTFAAGASAQGAPSSAWATVGAGVFAPTGQVNLLGTNGATWNITGIQFEVGTVATSFDFRSYSTELPLCQRYYFQTQATATNWNYVGSGVVYTQTLSFIYFQYPVVMRSAPTISTFGTINSTNVQMLTGGITTGVTSLTSAGSLEINAAATRMDFTTPAVLTVGQGAVPRLAQNTGFTVYAEL